MQRRSLIVVAAALACEPMAPVSDPIFRDGRAIAAAGDSLLAYTVAGQTGLVITGRRGDVRDTLARDLLTSPFHVQEHAGRWYVSDIEGGHARITELDQAGHLVRRIDVDALASAPHQFAVLPDGRIVLETPDGALIALMGDSVDTFAVFERGERTGLLVAAQGGVLHAAPGRSITLYNANGKFRWRLEWPWRESAFIGDLSVDARGRAHVLAGEQQRRSFVVFSLSSLTGEVVRWSEPGQSATFSVGRLGEVEAR